MTTNPITELVKKSGAEREAKARALRPHYFAKIDSLLASGAFSVEDRRKTRPPTGRRYR